MAERMVVVVEDDADTREFMNDFLTDAGYRVVALPTAKDARALIQREQPSVIILDLHINGEPAGWTLLEQLRADATTAQIPAILYSAGDQFLRNRQAELRALRCDILLKPFSPDKLLATLAAAVEG